MHFQLALQVEHETPKRTKMEGEEIRNIATKMSSLEYTSINQIEEDLYSATKGVLSSLPYNTQPYNDVTKFFALAQNILLNRPSIETKQPHTLRSLTNGTQTPSPQVPGVRAPLREFLYTMGPNGPLFTSIAARDTNPLIAEKLPSSLTLPTSTGGTFTASSATMIPLNVASTATRKLLDTTRKPASYPRRRGDFSDDTLGKIQAVKWLDWGTHASFAPEWDDGGVGGGFGAGGISVDWAYKRLKRKSKRQVKEVVSEVVVQEVIDEKLLLEWKESTPPRLDEEETENEIEDKEMSVDETLTGLRDMILLLGQLQTLRMASGKTDIPEDEKSLGTPPSPHLPLKLIYSRQHCNNIPNTNNNLLHPPQKPPLPPPPQRLQSPQPNPSNIHGLPSRP